MVVLSNTTEQTIQPGQSITLDKLITSSGCGEAARSGGPLILRYNNAVYDLDLKTNLTGPTAAVPLQLSLAVEGGILPETTVIYTPAAANAVGSVSTQTYIKTFGNNNTPFANNSVTIVNTGENPITIPAGAVKLSAMRRG